MPDHARRLAPLTRAALTAAAFFVTLLAPAAARAQSGQDVRGARRVDMEIRQRVLRDLERLKRPPANPLPDRRPAYREVAEEFRQLQLVNYSLASAADVKVPLDYARIRKESAEVRKRASRLKGYLLLPEVEEAQKPNKGVEALTPEALRSAVGALDALVNSFVWNPVFQRPDVVDLEQSSKASRDLGGIISLSEQIRKCAEELSKGDRSVAKN